MHVCKFCDELFYSSNIFATHVRWCKKNPKNTVKHGKTLTCTKCNTQFSLLSAKDRRTTCSDKCARKFSDEMKKVISEKRKDFLSKNPEKHVWKRKSKFVSVPCENVKSYLVQNNIPFAEEYSPLDDRFFSIDIAFPHSKIGIEINGNQHYENNGHLKKYYQERHDTLEKAGWKIIQVHYSKCFSDESISNIFRFESPIDHDKEAEFIKSKLNRHDKSTDECAVVKRKSQADKKWQEIKNNIFDHGIDFSKFGWVGKVSAVIGLSPQKIKSWMIKYHKDFYDQNCFKKSQNWNTKIKK